MKRAKVTLRARCTTCRKVFEVTDAQLREARDIGCLVSGCCFAVSTLESAAIKRKAKA